MDSKEAQKKFLNLPGNAQGAIILLFASAGFTIMMAIVKLLGERMDVTQILLVRQIGMIIIVAPTIFSHFPGSLRSSHVGLQFLRIVLAIGAMLFGFTAAIHMPLADATAIGFAKSFFVTIFAMILLKEVVGPRRWAAVGIGFLGVLLMLRPGGGGEFSIYGLYALIGAACAGLVMVIIRLLSRTDSPNTILTYQALGVGVVMAVPGIMNWVWPTPFEWVLLVGLGLTAYVSQMANIWAYKLGEASVMASLDYVRLLYATAFGWMLFGHLPGISTWIGAAIIIAASIYTIHREAQRKQALTRGPDGRGYTNT